MRIFILAFSTGVLLLQVQAVLPAWLDVFWGGLACLLGWLAGLLYRKRWRRFWGLPLCLLLGFAWAAWRAELRLSDQLGELWQGQDIELIGVIAAMPQDFPQGARFEFVVEQVLTAEARLPSRLMLSWYQGQGARELLPNIQAGERWHLTVRLKRPHGQANPWGFDYEAWLLERNIRATGYVRPGEHQRLESMVWRADYCIEAIRQKVRQRFDAVLPAATYPYAGVLLALAIGDQKAIQGDLWPIFNRAGITHLVSISGLHVTMLAAVLGGLVNWGWRRCPRLAKRWPAQRAGLLAGCLMAFLYALLAGFSVPAQRTVYMLCVAALSSLCGRVIAPSQVLCLALLVVVLLDPWALLAAGFWLSFGAVAALLFVGAAQVGEGRGWVERLRLWGSVQWAATLASLPILLLVFQQFSLVSPLANALAIPVVSFLVTPLVLLAVLLPWWPILWLAHAVLAVLMQFIVLCASWPVWQAAAPPEWVVGLAALGVVTGLLPRAVPGRWLGIFFLLPCLFWRPESVPEETARIIVLDVGQGLASVVLTRHHVLVYDPGPLYSAESDAGQRVLVPYLRALGINRLDLLIVTHKDTDHSGGAASLRSALPVDDLLSSMEEIGARPCVAGQHWQWDGVQFEILHPLGESAAVNRKSNHQSCVLRVSAGGRRMLLTSDIEAADERALLERDTDSVAADVLLVPHHGSKTSSTLPFLQAVGAKEAVVPVGYLNRFGHPKAEVLARYEGLGMRLWRTDQDGAIQIELARQGVHLQAWRKEHARYWHGR